MHRNARSREQIPLWGPEHRNGVFCTVLTCFKPRRRYGLCEFHSMRKWQGLPVEVPVRTCEREDCDRMVPRTRQSSARFCSDRCRTKTQQEKESSKEARRRYRAATADHRSEQSRAWREANRERKRALDAAWYAANKDRHHASSAAWKRRHPAESKAMIAKWRSKNPDKVRGQWHRSNSRRHALMQEATEGYEWFSHEEIFERDKWTCGICSDPVDADLRRPDPMSASLDHVIPLSKGGPHCRDNVQLAHLRCNIRKSDKLPPEASS